MPYRVLVVDDSIFMRKMISQLIEEDSRFEVVDTARNGQEAVEKAKRLTLDCITMDVEMPVMNGLAALGAIMAECPTPVIMLSSLTVEGAQETIEALTLGALDFIAKPSGTISLDLYKVKQQLHELLFAAVHARSTILRRPGARSIAPQPYAATVSSRFKHLIAIGASTGGPRALLSLLSQLPSGFPAPILIVQHMPPKFTQSLAQRLHEACQIRVVEAEDGLLVTSGTAYIAPGGWHMTLTRAETGKFLIRLSKADTRNGHRPSVDVLFESLVPFDSLQRHAVLLTGMGSDGAGGMQALQAAGAVSTIAESEESCVIFGMPRSAIELGSATHVLPLPAIGDQLIRAVTDESHP
jgi:two-component system chemotaxis response regulator CheB